MKVCTFRSLVFLHLCLISLLLHPRLPALLRPDLLSNRRDNCACARLSAAGLTVIFKGGTYIPCKHLVWGSPSLQSCRKQAHNCSSRKCLGLSFFSLPRRGVSKEQDEWRASLIHAISRSDKSFNPATAKICSRHFEEKCIRKSNYQTLVCASIFSPFSLLCAHQKFRICP